MNYNQLKKLDEDSLGRLREGSGPADECICSILAPPDEERKGLGASIKKAIASITPGKKRRNIGGMGGGAGHPLMFTKGEENGIFKTSKEVVKRASPCGKCGCDKDKVVLKHSYANIRITSPDVSTICSCSSNCLADKTNLMNNIKVTVEHVIIDPDSENSEASLTHHRQNILTEPVMSERMSVNSLINAQYENSGDDFIYHIDTA